MSRVAITRQQQIQAFTNQVGRFAVGCTGAVCDQFSKFVGDGSAYLFGQLADVDAAHLGRLHWVCLAKQFIRLGNALVANASPINATYQSLDLAFFFETKGAGLFWLCFLIELNDDGAHAVAFDADLTANTSGLMTFKYMSRARGIPAVRHSETDPCLTSQIRATSAVPPNLSMISDEFMRLF